MSDEILENLDVLARHLIREHKPHSASTITSAISEITRLRSARNAALEEAANCCPGGSSCDPQQIADAIRALKDKGHD